MGLCKPSITGVCCYGGDHLLVTESTTNQVSIFDLRMILDQLDAKYEQISMNKSLVCQLDGNKHSKKLGSVSMRLDQDQLAVVGVDNSISVYNMNRLDLQPPKILSNSKFSSSFYTKPQFIDGLIASGTKNCGEILIWDLNTQLGGTFTHKKDEYRYGHMLDVLDL